MDEHDWQKFADLNNLSPEEFGQEIMLVALAYMSTQLDTEKMDAVSFTSYGYRMICCKWPESIKH